VPILNLGIPSSEYPDLVDKFSGRLVIVGGARCVWNDLGRLGFTHGAMPKTEIMVINDIVMHFPGAIKHFYSNDSVSTPKWIAARRRLLSKPYGNPEYVHTCRKGRGYNWPWPGHGTSAMGAVYTGLALGYEKIILCGIPLDNTGHYFDPPWVETNFIREVGFKGNGQIKYWRKARDEVFMGRVFAMSGRLVKVLEDAV